MLNEKDCGTGAGPSAGAVGSGRDGQAAMNHGQEADTIWKRAFPVQREADVRVTRRGFTLFLGMASVAGAFGFLAPSHEGEVSESEAFPAVALEDLSPGGSAVIQDPEAVRPVLLIRTTSGELLAYDQRCTHLLCPVHYEAAGDRIVCPCHHGIFDTRNGRPVAGPPRIPLRRYQVEVREGMIHLRRAGVKQAQ